MTASTTRFEQRVELLRRIVRSATPGRVLVWGEIRATAEPADG